MEHPKIRWNELAKIMEKEELEHLDKYKKYNKNIDIISLTL